MIPTRGKAEYCTHTNISPTCGVGRGENESEGISVQHATADEDKVFKVLKLKKV